MPKGKDIYSVLSKKQKDKDKRKGKPTPPPVVNNFKVNKPTFARSLNQHPQADEKKRVVSPAEGKPTVNAKSDVKKLIHKPGAEEGLDPASGAIKSSDLGDKKKRGRTSKKTTSRRTKNNNT